MQPAQPTSHKFNVSYTERMRFIKMRQSGITLEEMIQNNLKAHKQAFAQKSRNLGCSLLETEKKVEQVTGDLAEQVAKIAHVNSAEFQCRNLERRVEKLRERQEELSDLVTTSQRELFAKKNLQVTLNGSLNNLKQMQVVKNSYVENQIIKVGGQISQGIANSSTG